MARRLHDSAAPRRRHRGWLTAALSVIGAFGAGWVLAPRAAVGHFHSAEAMDRYFAAYDRAMAQMPNPQQVLDIRTSFGVVRVYRFAGARRGAPLFLLPGARSGTPVWANNMPSLLAHRSVYAVDLLGEPGRSIQSRPIVDAHDQAAWLHEVLEQLPDTEVNLLGLSLGGWSATNLALRDRSHIRTLTLVEPVQVLTRLSPAAILRSIPASVPGFPKAWRNSFASWTAGGAPVRDVPAAAMIEAGMQAYRTRTPTPDRISPEQLTSLKIPTLVILAAESPMHDAHAGARTARTALPTATVKIYDGASHAINGERPEQIAADVAAFLGKHRS
ncbi:MAG: alpha/beta hydrolase [Actinomycetota bacterium]|nr:alpha/beta hydrolase [Actinomycetota bacterium]